MCHCGKNSVCLCCSYLSRYFQVVLSNLHQVKMQRRWTLWNLTQDIMKREERLMRMAAMMKEDMHLVFSVHISEQQKTLLEAILFCGILNLSLSRAIWQGYRHVMCSKVLYRIIFLTNKRDIFEAVHTIQRELLCIFSIFFFCFV